MAGVLLTLNAGSSSLKFSVYENDLTFLFKGSIEAIGKESHFSSKDASGRILADEKWQGGYDTPVISLLEWLRAKGHDSFTAVGHRVVHGGREFTAPVLIDGTIYSKLDALCPLAPLHQPHNLNAIHTVYKLLPGVPQVACFDTAFHHTMPAVATRFGLPYALEEEGVRRYGFHGLSYEYIALQLAGMDPALGGGRVIVAHLGNGASLCAMHHGKSVDTTMGFSALDGLLMGTRPGSLDPEVTLYLMREKGMTPAQVEDLLYHRSGLLGVSGVSNDMRELLASSAPRAQTAIELFVYRIVKEIGALASALGGLDRVVFTAGIGEHSPEIRRRVCEGLSWLGAALDETANKHSDIQLHTPASRIKLMMIPTDEEAMIAAHTNAVLLPTAQQEALSGGTSG